MEKHTCQTTFDQKIASHRMRVENNVLLEARDPTNGIINKKRRGTQHGSELYTSLWRLVVPFMRNPQLQSYLMVREFVYPSR